MNWNQMVRLLARKAEEWKHNRTLELLYTQLTYYFIKDSQLAKNCTYKSNGNEEINFHRSYDDPWLFYSAGKSRTPKPLIHPY
jgi:hypothetical protein